MNSIDRLRSETGALKSALEQCVSVDPSVLAGRLTALGPRLIAHLDEEDRLYQVVQTALKSRGDTGGANLLGIFEQNMKVVSAGVRGFFSELPKLAATPPQLQRRFGTVLEVLKNRFDTEDRVVPPIFARCPDALS